MKKVSLIALLLVSSFAQAAGLEYYKEGAICDRKSGFCADFMGVSVALTKMYLGDKAEQKLMAEINKVGLQDFDATTFTMRGGLNCDTKVKTCWTNRYDKKVDVRATQTLFGK
ncbi:YcgJ family protein [Dechloromonas sp. HYN0024]|uniref:YcgJ family protein n=1 Tax=Dechloromonas sp. HYN0024 TaxID=2231055 RepID=UPI000E434CA6|nr:YcgJ family protein [Dechloromonas sp. HYN0024]AXS79452.1 hypothetical protein HYN24_05080 [Dechloromonas sp. HYN0024]